MLRRQSVHAAGATEETGTYVWEELRAKRYEDGAASTFRNRSPDGAMHEHALAGTLHLEHLAQLAEQPRNSPQLDVHVRRLSRGRSFQRDDIRHKLHRMLTRHAYEWTNFLKDLGTDSFVAKWAAQVRQARTWRA